MKRGEEALAIVAGHTDSPCLKLRPISKKEKSGYKLVGVETYGGGIWATWVSRCHEEGSVRATQKTDLKLGILRSSHFPLPEISSTEIFPLQDE
jgi:aspartyl aminopeptidase